ncbi:pyruvate kinase [bacterium]|nr:pyruvate kinase [bacterium]
MKVKIVATIGPSTSNFALQKKLVKAGLNVARFNFSHGKKEEFKEWAQNFRRISEEFQTPVAVLQDLQGPRIRLGEVKEVELKAGQKVKVSYQKNAGEIVLDNPEVFADLRKGERILINDGVVALKILAKKKDYLLCEVQQGGKIRPHAGVNLPDSKLSLPSLTEKDKGDALFGLEIGVDYIALSFVRSAEDVRALKEWLKEHTDRELPRLIAKIEKKEAIENIDEILEVADGIMIARGDLGIEIPREEVPLWQKRLTRKALLEGKISITATQMLDSMTHSPVPTRAEVSDVANAILDGTDAVMLSQETAIGDYPLEAVKEMAKVIEETENLVGEEWLGTKEIVSEVDVIGSAACEMALNLKAKYIVCVTNSGYTALMVSKHRPPTPILALTPSTLVWRQLSLVWGVRPMVIPRFHTTDELLLQAKEILKERGLAKKGDRLIIVAGHPAGIKGQTNLLKFEVLD